MIADETALAEINSPVRAIRAKVEMYEGSTLVATFAHGDRLISITVERVGDSGKFFGFGVAQKTNIHLIDVSRELSVTTANTFKVYFNDVDCLPLFKVTEVNRDENTNELSITAYDKLNESDLHTMIELGYVIGSDEEEETPPEGENTGEEATEGEGAASEGTAEEGSGVESGTEDETTTTESTEASPYTIREFSVKCAELLGASELSIQGMSDDSVFDTLYPSGANFDGTETIRECLTAVAEATQTIYFIDRLERLVFKRMDVRGDAAYTIDKSQYITLSSKTNRRLATIYNSTELGNDVYASITKEGSTQYVRDNPFWDLRDDIATLVDNALAAVGGMTINQFDCSWRGNFLLEIGDKIAMITKDDGTDVSYLLDDTIEYNGSYSQNTQWDYEENDTETSKNPTSLGDAIKKTYAKVDKANKQIDLVASDVDGNSQAISSIQINADVINQSVTNIHEDIEKLTNRVDATMTAEEVKLEIKSELDNGVSKVVTNTGFTFDETGLTVSKSDSELSTTITEDGMRISRDDEEVLKVDNTGVDAANLRATTYLIIGLNSRFEDYDNNTRTGCFWIGESEVE